LKLDISKKQVTELPPKSPLSTLRVDPNSPLLEPRKSPKVEVEAIVVHDGEN